jgi:PAP2 superfamily
MRLFIFAIAVICTFSACKPNTAYKTEAENPIYLHQTMRRIIDILRHDIFAPPIAARIFSYASVASYEAMVPGYPEYKSAAGQLNGLTPAPMPEAGKEYCFQLASTAAMLFVGKQLVFSETDMEDKKEDVFAAYEKMGMPKDVFKRSVEYGEIVGKHILAWAKKDNYAQTRSAAKFSIDLTNPSRWTPTPPQYGDALEPHWSTIRSYTLDSATQYLAPAPIPFSEKKGSDFYKSANEVYEIGKRANPDEQETGLYWDDNPFQVTVSGHLMIGTKKISPGAHWMNIAGYACRKANTSFPQTAAIYMKAGCAMHDAFISCWTTKYKYNVLRPETYINRYMDAEWRPNIETPPFPEYTSGHATVSASAATVLTEALGDNFAFTDSTEVQFDLPARSFGSFYEAADQSALSRLYAGIHYRNGNEQGRLVGRKVGAHVVSRIRVNGKW